jgi:hypothetical protein
MLLNGDGEARLYAEADKDSVLSKLATGSPPQLVDLQPVAHARGNWDGWAAPRRLLRRSRKEATRRRAEGATLDELARSCNVGISTIRRATRAA